MLKRPMFTGGTVSIASVKVKKWLNDSAIKKQYLEYQWFELILKQGSVSNMHDNHEGFEDGTPNFLSIGAIKHGLQFLEVMRPVNLIRNIC